MGKPKGGRGCKAPYESAFIRVPKPVKQQAEELVARYRDFLDQGGDPQAPPRLLDVAAISKPVNDLWRVGERCACIMPSGVIIADVRIDSIDTKNRSCKVVDDTTHSHWLADLKDLVPVAIVRDLIDLQQQVTELSRQRDELDQEVNQLHESNGDLNLELEELRCKPLDKFVNNFNYTTTSELVNEFIESKRLEWGQNNSQKGNFAMSSRTWDVFRQFLTFIEYRRTKDVASTQ